MIFPSHLIDDIQRGLVTATVRPALPSHPRKGPWTVGQQIPVRTGGYADDARVEQARIEVTAITRTTLGELDVATLRNLGCRRGDGQRRPEAKERAMRAQLNEYWMDLTGTETAPDPGRAIWLLTFDAVERPRYLARGNGYTTNPGESVDVGEILIEGRVTPIPLEAVSPGDLHAYATDAEKRTRKARPAELTIRELNSVTRRTQRVRDVLAAKGDVDLLDDVARLSAMLGDLERRANAA